MLTIDPFLGENDINKVCVAPISNDLNAFRSKKGP